MKYAQIFAIGTVLAMLSLLVGGGCALLSAAWMDSGGDLSEASPSVVLGPEWDDEVDDMADALVESGLAEE